MKIAKILGRIVLAALAYIVGVVVSGMLVPVLHLPSMKEIPGSNPQQMFLLLLLSSPLLIVGIAPLARYLQGGWLQRCMAMALMLYVTLGLNTLIEAKIFTGLVEGSPWLASLQFVLPSVLTAAVLTYGSGEASASTRASGEFGATGWAWRLCLAWLAFPVIYLLFGMCVAPIVVPYYNASSVLGLHVPAMSVIIRTQLLRSAILLAASLPLVVLWTKSRGSLILALGLAEAMTIGIFQLAPATFFPMALRIAHSVEITADSFAYAAVLGLLFLRSSKRAQPALSKSSAAA